VVLIFLGTFLRGPNWEFFGPYEFWDPHRTSALNNIDVSHIFWLKIMGRGRPTASEHPDWPIAMVAFYREWLGIVLVIIFSAQLGWLPPTGAGPDGSGNWRPDTEHLRYIILPAITMSVIPMGIIARTVRALVADILSQEFVQALRAKGLGEWGVFKHVVTNAAPTALAVMGLQLGYLLGGSILIETVFAWPGTGFLLNAAIFQRDLPLLQGTILVLAMFFVMLNLLVDVLQTTLDPRIQRT